MTSDSISDLGLVEVSNTGAEEGEGKESGFRSGDSIFDGRIGLFFFQLVRDRFYV